MKAWFSLLFISVAALQSTAVLGRSISKRQVWQIGSLTSEIPQCVPFTHPICNRFSNHTLSFNPSRGDSDFGLEDLLGEFRAFERLELSNCHPNIILFLCFSYFPFCHPSSYGPSSVEDVFNMVVYPCHETCEEVHDSACTDLVKQVVNTGWALHLRCNHSVEVPMHKNPIPIFPQFGGSRICTNGGDGGNAPGTDKGISSGKEVETTTEETAEETTTTKKMVAEMTTQTPCPTDCPHNGRFRHTCTANTFKQNCFEFAARVNITSKTVSSCNSNVVFTVNVIDGDDYELVTDQNGDCRRAPRLPESAEIQTDWHESCIDCPHIKVGTQYLIAGYYSQDEDSNTVFRLLCDNSLVSQWNPKYKKKISRWLNETDRYRRQLWRTAESNMSSKCQNFCN